MDLPIVVFVQGNAVKINKWQTNFFTEEAIQQLQNKPQVILRRSKISDSQSTPSSWSENGDHSVPDLTHVASYVECRTTTDEEIQSEQTKTMNNIDQCIEAELDKMFGTCISKNLPKLTNINNKNQVISKSNKTRKISKKRSLRDLLIRLFGSDLDDIEIEKITGNNTPRKLNKNRRYSLPISINILNEDFLKPLKVSKKRKSENDANLNSSNATCKVRKLSTFELKKATIGTLSEFIVAKEFVEVEVDTKTICSTTVLNEESSKDLVVTKPKIQEASEIKVAKNNTINLTVDSSARIRQPVPLPISFDPILLQNGIKIEVLEPSQSNKEESTSALGFSMPLLSPVTPAESGQSETSNGINTNRQVVENSSQRVQTVVNWQRPDTSLVPVSMSQISQQPPPNVTIIAPPVPNKSVTPSQNSPFNSAGVPLVRSVLQQIMQQCSAQQKRPLQNENRMVQNNISPSGGNYQVQNKQILAQTTQSHSNNQSTASKLKQLRPMASKRQKVSAAPQSSPQQQQAITITTKNNMPYLPQQNVPLMTSSLHLQRISQIQPPTQQPPAYQQNLQNLNQNNPPAPRLIRLNMGVQDGYHLLSNGSFAVKVFPHLYIYTQWRENANTFCLNMKTFLSQKAFKENYDAFSVYAVHTTQTFGKKLIQDLLGVDVDNFSLNEIFFVLVTKLQEKNVAMNMYRVCMYFASMMRGCEGFCATPFTQKFYKHIALAMEKIEMRLRQGAVPPLFQPHQLKLLEWQIQKCLLARNWISEYEARMALLNNRNNNIQTTQLNRPLQSQQPLQPVIQQRNQDYQKQNNEVPLRQTVLRNLLQTQNNPDRSGISDNLSNFNPNTTANAIDKQINPPQQTISETHRRALLQVNGNVGCGNITQNRENSSSVPSLNNSSNNSLRESSVPEIHSKDQDVKPAVVQNYINSTEIIDLSEDLPHMKTETKKETQVNINSEEVIDLTWIDDGDEAAMMEEITNHRAFPFKAENDNESDSDTSNREVVSPVDSGLGSPRSQADSTDVFKCLCGEKAIYVCACNSSMYCSRECQISDWTDHQRWCQEMKTT